MSAQTELENQQLRARLQDLLAAARDTERKLDRAAAFELRLLGANDLSQILDLLLDDLRLEYGLDHVGLRLADPDGAVAAALSALAVPLDQRAVALVPGVGGAGPDPDLAPELYLGDVAHCPGGAESLGAAAVASVALVPLWRAQTWIGQLVLGSADPQRYAAGMQDYILRHLAAVIAICIENAMTSWRLAELGVTDALTGLRNRRYFDQRLLDEVARVARDGSALGCLFADIDRFKSVNDHYGHATGDQVIAQVAARLSRHLRSFDLLARYGGEEFVMLLPGLDARVLGALADRIRDAVASAPLVLSDGRDLWVTISIGAAVGDAQSLSGADARVAGETLVAAADAALLAAKRGGRNRVVLATMPPPGAS